MGWCWAGRKGVPFPVSPSSSLLPCWPGTLPETSVLLLSQTPGMGKARPSSPKRGLCGVRALCAVGALRALCS